MEQPRTYHAPRLQARFTHQVPGYDGHSDHAPARWLATARLDYDAPAQWAASFDDTTPTSILAAFTTALADPNPVDRYELPRGAEAYLTLTPPDPHHVIGRPGRLWADRSFPHALSTRRSCLGPPPRPSDRPSQGRGGVPAVSCTRVTHERLPVQTPPRRRIPQIDHDSMCALGLLGALRQRKHTDQHFLVGRVLRRQANEPVHR
ncbi:DUF317 domain-containing protein [Streptomyces cupreus]|uniref:DUF317 domain-containing protein n=1 Tax=Streptomyces cupreus TaxID=2759956 RepID=UPI003AB9535D